MAFARNYRHLVVTLLAIVSTSLLIWFGNGLNPWWPLLWFAPLPILLFSLRSSWWSTALTVFFSLMLGGLNLWHYFRVLGAPPSTWVVALSISAFVFASGVLLFRVLILRGAVWSALLAFPATWVTWEYVRNLISPHGTAGSFAYSQLNFLPFLQFASITGPWGMSFLLLLFPAGLAIWFHFRYSEPQQARHVLTATLGVIVAVLLFGFVRLALPAPKQQVRVGLITSDESANANVPDEGALTERLFRDYAGEAEKLVSRGAQIIVLPEKLGVVEPNTKGTDEIFQSLADRTQATIVVGLAQISPPVKYNQARVYAPGDPVLSYDKHHMLPPFESNLKPGTTLTVFPMPSAEIGGVAICKDMDFTQLSRQYGNAGVGLMLVPAWDFNLDRSWHGHIAVMRAVESGFSLVRSAKNGYLTVTDNRGRILAELRSDSAPFATLLAEVPTAHDSTPYLLLGDWFAWLSIAMLCSALMKLYQLRSNIRFVFGVIDGGAALHNSVRPLG
jgi:apolipoprotein N-acyltransferase